MSCFDSIKEEIKKHHPDLNLNDECIKGLIEILKKKCPHFNSDLKKSDKCCLNKCTE
jgi:hypothetical protein